MPQGETVYGKLVSDLQSSDTTVGDSAITGTLNYVTGYTGFNGTDPSEQEGNYLALEFLAEPWPDTLTVELVGGEKGPVTLTEGTDDYCVFLVTDNSSQQIKVKATVGESSEEKTYSLTGLTLTPEE